MNSTNVCLKAAKMLREMEWSSYWYEDAACPRCGALKDRDLPKTDKEPFEKAGEHKPSCDLWVTIRELDTTEGTAAKAQRLEQQAMKARGTCPRCQFFNHPDSDVMSGRLRYCSNCGEAWPAEDPV